MPRRVVRKFRHWRQRFDPNGPFIWRRRTTFGPETYEPGDPIPDLLQAHKAKLRRFWESQWVELADFQEKDVSTGQSEQWDDLPPGVTVGKGKGTWYVVTTPEGETNVNGGNRLAALLDELRGSHG